jgi:peroxiredoxin
MKRTFQIFALIALAALVFKPQTAAGQFFFMEDENIGKPMQDFTLKTLNGGESSLTELRQGQRALVFFWATWCPHCREALNKLTANRDEIDGKGIKVILVDVGESPQAVAGYLEKNKIDRDVMLDEKTEVATLFGIIGVPTFYFLNEEGIVGNVLHGYPDDLDAAFTKTK